MQKWAEAGPPVDECILCMVVFLKSYINGLPWKCNFSWICTVNGTKLSEEPARYQLHDSIHIAMH